MRHRRPGTVLTDSTPRERTILHAVTVRLPTTFATRIGGARQLAVTATCVGAALQAVTARHPELQPLIWLNGDALNPVIMIFHNETLIRDDMLESALTDGDVIDVVPAVESG